MSKLNVVKLVGRQTIFDPLTELLRKGAERVIFQAVQAEQQKFAAILKDSADLISMLAQTTGIAGNLDDGGMV